MKKAIFPLLTLIIGFAAGYYFSCLKSKGAQTEAIGGPYTSNNSISVEEAQMMVDTFGKYGMQDNTHKPGGGGKNGMKTRAVFLPLTKLDSLCAALDAA